MLPERMTCTASGTPPAPLITTTISCGYRSIAASRTCWPSPSPSLRSRIRQSYAWPLSF
jgi:hypothetical protein